MLPIIQTRWLLLGVLGLAMSASASSPFQVWTERYTGPANASTWPQAVAVGPEGHIYVTGYVSYQGQTANWFTIASTSGGVPLWTNLYQSSPTAFDNSSCVAVDPRTGVVYAIGTAAIVAYNSAGAPLWTNRSVLGGGQPLAAAVATNGNVYLTGGVGGMEGRYVTAACSSSGVPLWTNISNSGGGRAIVVDEPGNVYVSGFFFANGGEIFGTIAYSSAGVPLWTNRYVGPIASPIDYPAGMALDNGRGRLYVVGSSDGGPGFARDFATVAYSTAGTALWTNRYNGPGNNTDEPTSIAVDSNSGNVYVTGNSLNANTIFDIATIAYSSNGGVLWINRFHPPGFGDSTGNAVAVDANGNVIVTGWARRINNVDDTDFVTIAYSSGGIPLWTNYYNGPASGVDTPTTSSSLAIAPDGGIYVIGSSDSASSTELALVKYSYAPDIRIMDIEPTNAAFRLTIRAPENVGYRLEASTNLSQWTPLTNFPPLPVTSIQFLDAQAAGPARFYRTVWSP